ncbi:hypothetical protein H0X06_05120 [Candidatus Dependentiae bacterium]|nr:hypothetical protein [Candidatus Dependentiae bacterium]
MIRSLICTLFISASTVFASSFSEDENPHHLSSLYADLPAFSRTGKSTVQECAPITVTFFAVPPTSFNGTDGQLKVSTITGGGNTGTYEVTLVGIGTQTFTGTPLVFSGLSLNQLYDLQVLDPAGSTSFPLVIPNAPLITIITITQSSCTA